MSLSLPLIDLSGKHALVTGGNRGVGRATCVLLARAGAHVSFTWRQREADAEEASAQIRQCGARSCSIQADLSDEAQASRVFDLAEASLGPVDFFIGNHGVWPSDPVSLAEMSTAQWRNTLSTNLDSLFFLGREASRRLRPDGRVVLVSSTAGQRGEAFHGDYAASKGALISLVKGWAVELAPRGITVNAVAPGWVDTEMVAGALDGAEGDRVRQSIPLGRIASADDVAGPIVFLCSPLARHVTAEILNVNGGAVPVG
jgi:3-oxoacyl-[acyl-carrier protein] reductase